MFCHCKPPVRHHHSCAAFVFVCHPFSAKATVDAISQTYLYLTPDLWKPTEFVKNPYQEFTDFLSKDGKHRAVSHE